MCKISKLILQPKLSEADAEQKTKKVEDEEEAEEEEVRPPMDLFKAIFASSSDEKSSSSSEEDSGEEEEQEAEPQTPVVTPALSVPPQAPPTSHLSSVTSTKYPFILKVINKHNFIIWTRLIYRTEAESRISSKGEEKDPSAASSAQSAQTADLECEEFGPRLPPPG